MTKKVLIISIASVVVVSLVVCGILLFLKGAPTQNPGNSDESAPKPGDAVALSETPEYKACEVLAVATIKPALELGLGDTVESLADGERSGVVAQNYEIADECNYTFATATSGDNTLNVQSYLYTADPEHTSANVFDTSWRNISKVSVPSYTLQYPAYFRIDQAEGRQSFMLQIVVNAKHYRFAIEQATGGAFDEDKALAALIALALKANYSLAQPTDAPPAPQV